MTKIQLIKHNNHKKSANHFEVSKRKFLASSISLFGITPFFQFFKLKNICKNPYLAFAVISSFNLPQLKLNTDSNFMKASSFKALVDKMLKQGKILYHHYPLLKEDSSLWHQFYIYVFDSRESYQNWKEAVNHQQMFLPEYLPNDVQYNIKIKSLKM